MILAILAAVALTGPCIATDGDTIVCGSERIRLTAIDAPEMPGHCRKGRDCVPGDPFASKRAMAGYLTQPLTIERIGTDRYGRTVADVFSAGQSVSCLQLASGHARYWPKYDHGQRIAKECGE
jgi:endonuclease YncB( thermonuclease family)